jgi:WD40 repeat protein
MPLSNPRSIWSGFVSLCMLAGVLVFSAPALAAAPEPPVAVVNGATVTARTVTLEGTLNPKAAGDPGEYEFLYEASATDCAEGAVAPEPAGIALGLKAEAVAPVELVGLQPSTQYTVCLLERNAALESTVGPAVSFRTAAAPPSVDGESVSAVSSTGATLEALVNANNQLTTYSFEYSATEAAGKLTGSIITLAGTEPLAGVSGDQTASVGTGAVLQPGTTYFYRVVAVNGTPPANDGAVQSFTTVPTPNTDAPTAVTATTATFNGHLTLDSLDTQYFFNYNVGSECTGGSSTPAADAGTGAGNAPQATNVTGLLPRTQYTVCFVTANAFGSVQGQAVSFMTLIAPPVVESESVTNVSGDSADLDAEVNPGGGETTYHFEYGTTTSYGQGTLESASIGADDSGHPASAHIQGLQPGTVYHYRVLASNPQSPPGGTPGADQTFTTQPVATPFVLPDGRQYELVSPPNKGGGEVILGGMILRSSVASADGTRVAYLANIPFAGPTANGVYVQIFSERGPQGWSSRDISPPHNSPTGAVENVYTEFRSFSSDLSHAVVLPFGPTALSALALEGFEISYLRDNGQGSYQPLLTRPPEGLSYKAFLMQFPEVHFNVQFAGGTPDLSHIVLESEFGLTENSGQPTQLPNLYEWFDGQLQLLSVGPEGLSTGGGFFIAISKDGSHVLWSKDHRALFVRDLTTKKTVSVGSTIREPDPFDGMISGDGSKAFFINENANGRQVYEFDLDSSSPKLVQVSNAPEEMKEVLGVSADGSYVYYVSTWEGEGDIYVAHDDGAKWTSTLIKNGAVELGFSAHTGPDPLIGNGRGFAEASVTSSGRYLAFTSRLDGEIYLYDASSNRLICTSCDPTGARPLGPSQFDSLHEDGSMFFNSSDALVAHDTNGLQDVYEWEPKGVGSCHEGSPGCVYLISSGTGDGASTFLGASANGDDVFFMARDRLVAQDFDNSFDVYDAHVCTAAEPCPASLASVPACTSSDACKAPPAPQPAVFGAPASATFSGAGNVVPLASSVKAKPKAKKKPRKHAKAKTKKQKRAKKRKKAKKARSIKSLSGGTKR